MTAMLVILCLMMAVSILVFVTNLFNSTDSNKSVGHRVVDILGSIVMMVFVVYLYYMMTRWM